MKCPKCNTFNNNSANFCRNCGVELPEVADNDIVTKPGLSNSTNDGPAWLGCLYMILGVVGGGLGLGFILYLLGF